MVYANKQVTTETISQEIRSFIDNPQKMVTLAREYSLPMPNWSVWKGLDKITGVISDIWLDRALTKCSFESPKDFSHNDPTHCYCLADALFARNFFNQKYVQEIGTFDQFKEALKDEEPGVFRLTTGSVFTINSGYFPSHALTLIKFPEKGTMHYRVVQIFQNTYNLSEFSEKYENEFQYENFSDLESRFLNPLQKVFYYTFDWEEENEVAYEKITKVRPNMESNPVPEKILREGIRFPFTQSRWKIQRTTDNGKISNSTLFHAISTACTVSVAASLIFAQIPLL